MIFAGMKVFVLVFLNIGLLLSGCTAQSGAGKMAAFQAKADAYLVKDDTVRYNSAILEQGVAMYASPADKLAEKMECFISWEEIPAFQAMVRQLPTQKALEVYLEKGDGPWDAGFLARFVPLKKKGSSQANKARPLAGLRIALDPGHLGGTMDFAQNTEKKYVRIEQNRAKGVREEVSFNEGNLTLATGLELGRLLREAGAEVLLTRESEGHCALGYGFETWLDMEVAALEYGPGSRGPHGFAALKQQDPKAYKLRCAAANFIRAEQITGTDSIWWVENASERNIYRIPFLKIDFRERANKINAFHPDLTLIIHYNIYEKNDADRQGFLQAVPQNYCMAFIPGSFMQGELDEPAERLAFLTKLLSNDLERSETLCEAVLKQHVQQLEIPIKAYDPHLRYLGKASLPTSKPGVFARNLSLTRMINGPLCFGESLYQDNIDECQHLNRKDFTPKGMKSPVPFRVKAVAQAYFDAVVAWRQQ